MKKISYLFTGLALMLFLSCENTATSPDIDEEKFEEYTDSEKDVADIPPDISPEEIEKP